MILELNKEVTVVERFSHFGHKLLQFVVRNVTFLIKSLELWQELSVVSIPVKTIFLFVIPQCIVGVQSFPEHTILTSITFLGLSE